MAAALDAVIVCDAMDRVVEFNPAAERIFRYPRAEAIGGDLADLIIPPNSRAKHRAAMTRHLTTGDPSIMDRRIQLTALRSDGHTLPIELTVTRIPESAPPLFVAFIRDLSEQVSVDEAVRTSEERFETLIEQIQDYAIFMLDRNCRATSWNEGVRRVLGFDEKEFLGLDIIPAIFTPEDIASSGADAEFQQAADLGSVSTDRWMQRRGGERFFALGVTVARRDRNGTLLGYAKIMRDRTEQKNLETRLRDTALELARANHAQHTFLATLSHELRNPLAPIRNGLALLRRIEGMPASAEGPLSIMERQMTHVVRLVDDLLDMSRLNQGKVALRKERIDLRESVKEAYEVAGPRCAAKRQRFEVDLPSAAVWVDADPTRMVQVIGNLLNNACKFTPSGGVVTLSLKKLGGFAVIRVRDTGVGLASEHLERIFLLFEQVESPGATKEGLGIGLGLSKGLVEMHGGALVASSPGLDQGSIFEVRLPLAPD